AQGEHRAALRTLDGLAPALVPPSGDAFVAHDGEQPGPEVTAGTIGAVALEGAQARRLDQIGRLGRRRQRAREPPQCAEMRAQLGSEPLSSPARLAQSEHPSPLPSPARSRPASFFPPLPPRGRGAPPPRPPPPPPLPPPS